MTVAVCVAGVVGYPYLWLSDIQRTIKTRTIQRALLGEVETDSGWKYPTMAPGHSSYSQLHKFRKSCCVTPPSTQGLGAT